MLRLVCLGDSITGPRPGVRYLHLYVKWCDLLQLVLETHLGVGQVEVLNHGFAGNTSSQALPRVDDEVVPIKPDIVIVLIGANNFGNHADPHAAGDRLRDDLIVLLTKLKKIESKILLLQYPDPRAEDMGEVWTHVNAGNPVIAEVARVEKVPTLELAPAFREAAASHSLAELASPVDGVHLNPYGEVVVARTVFFELQSLGWIPSLSG
jgi:lysophospholipase L1-like esterase